MALERDGSVGGGLFTNLVRKARDTKEVKDLMDEAEKRFEVIPWQLLSAAAHVSASERIDNPNLAARYLFRIDQGNLAHVHEGVIRAVLGNASKHKNSDIALRAFRMIPVPSLTDFVRVIHTGPEATIEAEMINSVLQMECSTDLDTRVIGVLLKACQRRHNFELGQRVWQWSQAKLRVADKELTFIIVQYLLLCGRTGNLKAAKALWDELPYKQPEVTGAMLSVLAANGVHNETSEFLSKIDIMSINSHMLVAALTAYAHGGKSEDALQFLEQVEAARPSVVGVEAYTALIDGYARKGDFKYSLDLVERLKKRGLQEDAVVWMTILSPCRRFKRVEVAKEAFDAIMKLGNSETRAAAYVLYAEVNKACGNEEFASKLHRERLSKGLTKERGAVTLCRDEKSYVFHVGQIPSELSDKKEAILSKLEEWSEWLSYRGVNDSSVKCLHSEKLALAYAVVENCKHVVMRKNLRVCSACHEASRELTLKEDIVIHHWDRSRLHVMENGKCSCGGHY